MTGVIITCVLLLQYGYLLVLPLCNADPVAGTSLFDITSFGAVADGQTDAATAVLAAWGKTCAWEGTPSAPATLLIPNGTFLVGPVTLKGPCLGPVVVKLQGTVIAPAEFSVFPDDYWVSFDGIQGLTVTGGGVFDGQGALAWKSGSCPSCDKLPTNVKFHSLNNATIEGISSMNSKKFHMEAAESEGVTFQFITITAPGDSPNTDGIHVSNSTGVTILDSVIGTGDDCISVGPGTTNLFISNITCGPGHGISVGSLGASPNEKDVSSVWVKNCSLTNTDNGVRIKSWPSSYAMSAFNITFEDIVVNNASNPIIIDQNYCPNGACDKSFPSKVQISNVTFRGITGTSASNAAVELTCSKDFPCRNVDLSDINLVSSEPGKEVISECSDAHGTAEGQMIPPACIAP